MSYEPPHPVGPIDPNAFTQPIPAVQQPAAPPPPPPKAPKGKKAAQPPQAAAGVAYVPTFGNFGLYLFTRWLAFIVDFVILPFAMATFAFQLYDRGVVAFAPRSLAGFAVLLAVAFGGALFMVLLFEALFGTSFGKALFALGVRRTNGAHPGLGRTLIRYALMPLDLLLIGPLLILLPSRRRLGDFASGTVVARNRIGVFATVLGALLLGGLVYAQVSYGGGVNSAIGVMAEGTAYGPPLVSEIAHAVGLGNFVPVIPVPAPSGTATSAAETAAPTTPGATTAASAAPIEPSSAPLFATPVPTAEPSVAPTPSSASTGLIRG